MTQPDPILIYAVKPFASHVTTRKDILRHVMAQYSTPAGYLNWNRTGGLQLPDQSGEPSILGELILLHHERPVTVFTIHSVRYRKDHKLHMMHYTWIRHTTKWRSTSYNSTPQPHGDERVQIWQSDAVNDIFRHLDEDMRGGE